MDETEYVTMYELIARSYDNPPRRLLSIMGDIDLAMLKFFEFTALLKDAGERVELSATRKQLLKFPMAPVELKPPRPKLILVK